MFSDKIINNHSNIIHNPNGKRDPHHKDLLNLFLPIPNDYLHAVQIVHLFLKITTCLHF